MSVRKKATIRDVAAAAGVSVTTVSDSIAGKGRLPDATRQKVRNVAEKLGYRPSAIARGLRHDGLGLIGICIAPAGGGGVLTDVSYWAAIVTHASQAILSRGLAPVLLPHSVEMLNKLRVPLDGAIVVDPLGSDPVLAYFERKRIHCLTIGRDLEHDTGHWVDDDIREGVCRLLLQTASKGARLGFHHSRPHEELHFRRDRRRARLGCCKTRGGKRLSVREPRGRACRSSSESGDRRGRLGYRCSK